MMGNSVSRFLNAVSTPFSFGIKTVLGCKRNILPYLGKNKEKPIIDKIYNFDDIDKARKYMMSNNQIGKIVVKL